MNIRLIMKTAHSISFEIEDEGIYHTKEPYQILLNGRDAGSTSQAVNNLFGLSPDTRYELGLKRKDNTLAGALDFHTDSEFVTINVKELGAAGDGISDDTLFLQAAIMACPPNGRVLIPKGTYKITCLFLKSGLNLELERGAVLLACTDPDRFPHFPGMLQGADPDTEYLLGTWEGEPQPMYAGILTGIGVTDVTLYGEGTVDGGAGYDNWWHNPNACACAYRPRMLFLNHCRNIRVQGLTFCNSPSWTIHPYFCSNLLFCGLSLQNPQISPNTDGIDPESCKNVEILGVHFSLGDDCIAVKSGKLYMGKKYRTPSENIHIRQCLMEKGHGAVTLGSEIGAGVKNLLVEKCLFSHTDRGLRVKTRRGRGKDSFLDDIVFRQIKMDHVMTPFTVNAFYFCDPDGKTEYVRSQKPLPVDDRTPRIDHLVFEDIDAANCHVAAAYFAGLPEQKIRLLEMHRCRISFARETKTDVPIMAEGIEPCTRRGLFASNIRELILDQVSIDGNTGEDILLRNVEFLISAT